MSSRSSETRRRILQATLDLLQKRAGCDVRMSDIARHAGITRQAVYLHFDSRAELLIAATFHLDDLKSSAARLAPSRAATSGIERLDAYIEAWCGYIPEIYPVAKALLAMSDTDEAAAYAWTQRMQDMREGCAAAIRALDQDRKLRPGQTLDQATDLLWTLLQVNTWVHLTQTCGWSQDQFADTMKAVARRLFVAT